jgi:prepilin-type N-terminal cleavage/methylation domain-containing protein
MAPRTTSRTGNDRAFTLVEITIVIFVMATMMAVAVPYFLHYYHEAKLAGAARQFATATQWARLQAVTRQREATLELDLDRQTYAVPATAAESEPGAFFDLPRGVRLVSAQVGEEPLRDSGICLARFFPNGTCDGLTVVFRRDGTRGGTAVEVDPVTARATVYGVR